MENKKRVLLSGATGFVGTQLCRALLAKDWQLIILSRRSESDFRKEFPFPCKYFQWSNPTTEQPPLEALTVDAVINLTGEPVVGKRWSELQKNKLRDSRILSTRNLVSALKTQNPTLQAFVSASAIGYYGNRGEEVLNELSSASDDFLSTLCKEWELEAQKAPGRCVQIRIGIVLARQGGALAQMMPIFQKGVGGRLGSGQQWMSWIHVNDLVRIFMEALENPKMCGPINAAAPEAVRNSDFTSSLAKQLKVKAFLPVPEFVLKIGLGEMAQMLLASQRVVPAALQSLGFKFQFSRLENALGDI